MEVLRLALYSRFIESKMEVLPLILHSESSQFELRRLDLENGSSSKIDVRQPPGDSARTFNMLSFTQID